MELPNELRKIVHQSVALLGQVIKRELGAKKYQRIENLRLNMTNLREISLQNGITKLQGQYQILKSLSPKDQLEIAHSFTLMLELVNSCENAYRSHRLPLKQQPEINDAERPQAIIYVLTAHPTEARSPQNIAIFHQIQNVLIAVLNRPRNSTEVKLSEIESNSILHLLEIAWRVSTVRSRSPKVKDEAEHIYSMLFRDDVFLSLIEKKEHSVPLFVRSWVGGDKDGHPGVNEKTLLQSLCLSRKKILQAIQNELSAIRRTLAYFPSDSLLKRISNMEGLVRKLRSIRSNDAKTIVSFRKTLTQLKSDYKNCVGTLHPCLRQLSQICSTFPGLVVPLELRESSDVLMSEIKKRKDLAIYRMLETVERISRGGDPRWYVRGFIISMTETMEHIQAAAHLQNDVFEDLRIPIIPLFEEATSLEISDQIVTEMTKDPKIKRAALNNWDGLLEIMVGYSDSAKEAGVLASRLAISEALPKLEKACEKAGLTPVFFHGSGGSIDRGGGSIEDQTAWWPKSALRRYKVTIQGEMVERSLATPAIANRQIESIVESASIGLRKSIPPLQNPVIDDFAKKVSEKYQERIQDPKFLKIIESATPYSYLNVLKIGSRPAKRATQLTVKSLRAIPWVLCWTQTRVLFPTWWGVGSSWNELNESQKSDLKKSFQKDPVFTSYIKALGFTLAKVEMIVWRLYLEQSALPKDQVEATFRQFENEFQLTIQCYQEICGKKELMWFRPWLGESIMLRSAMIHPLNLLQIIAKTRGNNQLLRVTVTGVSSGMLTTG